MIVVQHAGVKHLGDAQHLVRQLPSASRIVSDINA